MMKIYAVVDTNVIVSAMISKNQNSAIVKVFKAIMDRRIIPMYNDEILDEYRECLRFWTNCQAFEPFPNE